MVKNRANDGENFDKGFKVLILRDLVETCPVCKGKGYIEVKGRDNYSAPECGTCKGTGRIEKK